MMPILKQLNTEINKHQALLVAVSKTKSIEEIMSVYAEGQRDFGENRVQELIDKISHLPNDVRWHLIGHLQTNKIKYLTPAITLIQSVDSVKLIEGLQSHGQKLNWKIPILLQLKIAQEDSKTGFDAAELFAYLDQHPPGKFTYLDFRGVMGIGTLSDNEQLTRQEFKQLKQLFAELKIKYFQTVPGFKEISMGMSHDYHIALEEGATMVRIGSLVFGARS